MPIQQTPPENTRLALDTKSNMHVLVRRVAAGHTDAANSVELEAMNELLMARDAGAFIHAVEPLGLMYGASDLHDNRLLDSKKVEDALTTRFVSPNADYLLRECYFDPFSQTAKNGWGFEEVGRVVKAPTNRAADELDLLANDGFVRDGYSYVIEPIHDWVILRNLMSISYRLLANGRTAAQENTREKILDASGFSYVIPQSSSAKEAMKGKPAYIIPVGYNPFFSRPTVDLTWKDENIWPFYCRVTEDDKTVPDKILGIARPRHLMGVQNVYFLTSVQADRAKASLQLKKKAKGPSDTWLYMAVAAEKAGQKETADAFFNGMDAVFGTRSISCCGGRGNELYEPSSPTNLPEAMWALAWEHPNRYLMSCRRCGRVQFSYMLGGETAFCSPGCRSAYSKAHRGEAGSK